MKNTPRSLGDGDDGSNGVSATHVHYEDNALLINGGIFSMTRVIQIRKARSCREDACDGAAAGASEMEQLKHETIISGQGVYPVIKAASFMARANSRSAKGLVAKNDTAAASALERTGAATSMTREPTMC